MLIVNHKHTKKPSNRKFNHKFDRQFDITFAKQDVTFFQLYRLNQE